MKHTGKSLSDRFSSLLSKALYSLVLVIGLAACGGGGGDNLPTPIPDQDASGLFKNGTADMNSSALMLDDLRGFVHNGRIIVFSINGHLLFDGTITNISSDDFTATVDVYEIGAKTQSDVTVTGTVISESSLSGTIAGTGNASGSFSLTFDTAYNTTATIEKIRDKPEDWEGNLLSTFSLNSDTVVDRVDTFGTNEIGTGVADNNFDPACDLSGTLSIPSREKNIYTILQDLPTTLGLNSTLCTLPLDPVVQYTGFAAVLSESSTENDLLYAITNDDFAIFGLLTIIP